MGLHWDDLDLKAWTLAITRGRVLVDGKKTVEGIPKTERGTCLLPLPTDVMDALNRMRTEQAAAFGAGHVRSAYLAVNAAGAPIRPELWSDMWRAHCRAAGIPAVTLHVARHTSVTAMRDIGIADHVVAAWHGHDEYIMRKVYSHAQSEGLAAAGNALEEAFNRSAKSDV